MINLFEAKKEECTRFLIATKVILIEQKNYLINLNLKIGYKRFIFFRNKQKKDKYLLIKKKKLTNTKHKKVD